MVFCKHGKMQMQLILAKTNPFPNEAEKLVMASQAGLSLNQINQWFVNARRRKLPILHQFLSHASAPLGWVSQPTPTATCDPPLFQMDDISGTGDAMESYHGHPSCWPSELPTFQHQGLDLASFSGFGEEFDEQQLLEVLLEDNDIFPFPSV